MSYVWLTEEQARQISQHALDDRPNEACGLLVGKDQRVQQIIPTPNTSNDPQRRFSIAPSALAQHLPTIEAQGLTLIGFYHSHPKGDPIPSQTDIYESHYPNVIHLIVGLKSDIPKLSAWQIDGTRVDSITLHISDLPPVTGIQTQHQLSNTQKNAIIITAIVALIVMLVLSINLLPPAPPIPTP